VTSSRTAPGATNLGHQGFGAMRLRVNDSADPDRDPFRVIDAALDAGVRMIDTADAYENEDLVGRAIARRRDDVVLASKFGLVWHDDAAGDFDVRADAEYVRQACDASLRRLQTDRIDLYYLHHRSDTVPIEETIAAMTGLLDAGKIGAIGLSNVTAEDLKRAHAVHPVTALQERWSLSERSIESTLAQTATALGVTIVAHSPTSHGALHERRVNIQTDDAKQATLREIAAAHEASVGQIALAWVHSRGPSYGADVVPLPGTTRVGHARANVAAASINLTPAELARLDDAWSINT
jgi:aryl-alcohol dehydrogenase-like predicted oxidoreductase